MTRAILFPLAIAFASAPRPEPFAFYQENVLGTSLELKVHARSLRDARRAEAVVLAEIDRLAKIFSGYDPQSEFSRWAQTRNQAVPVSPELFDVLSRFDRYGALTAGALDPAADGVNRLWQRAAAEHRVPSDAEMQAAAAAARDPKWSLDPIHRTATHLSSAPLILNSFTKSYIAGRAAHTAKILPGVDGVVVNIGGDLVISGPVEEVHVTDPRNPAENAEPAAKIRVRDAAVATSGNYRRGVEIAGRHYSHIVDPRTGRPVEHILSSTVVAPDPSDAGALATAFSVLTPEESAHVAAQVPGVEYLLIARDGRRYASPGWSRLAFAPQQPTPPPQQPPAEHQHPTPPPQVTLAPWNPEEELTVNFELARVSGKYRRPYVGVWIEDTHGNPVRTLAVWRGKDRYLPDLRVWYASDRKRKSAGQPMPPSVTGATRSPGRYTLKWDGMDNKGQLVRAGKYIVNIEAVREHGTHQLIKQEMDFSGEPKQIDLQGGTEIASASLTYGRKTH